jgi:hypothetical protein
MKSFSAFLLLAIALLVAYEPVAHTQQQPRDVVYINGIGNDFEDALKNLRALHDALVNTPTRDGSDRRAFRVWLQYNQVGWLTSYNDLPVVSLQRDVREMFLLKVGEECFLDSLRAIVVPHNELGSLDRDAAMLVSEWSNDLLPGTLLAADSQARRCGENPLVSEGEVTATSVAPLQSAASSLAVNVRSLGGAIVVAHSQGNLLANLAYASLAAEIGDDVTRLMRVVNVANTSAVAVHGLDLTHDRDYALDELRTLGPFGLLDKSRITPYCGGSVLAECPFELAPPTLTVSSLLGTPGFLEHAFDDTYLSDARVKVRDGLGVQLTVGADRMVDRFVDFVYAASASLELANRMLVTSVSCDSPVVGTSMSCTVTGAGLPPDTSFSATNCSPALMVQQADSSASQRRFTCAPQAVGAAVQVTYGVPGYVGSLPEVRAQVALAPPVNPPSGVSGVLNDTGASTCVGRDAYSSLTLACTSSEAIAANARQDGMVGRDVAANVGIDGALGFSFEGVPNGSGGLFPRTDCVRDRVTGLIWEGKPVSGGRGASLTYRGVIAIVTSDSDEAYATYVNALALCGFTDWRLPTIRELQGIVHYGASVDLPAIDLDWFANAVARPYRSSTTSVGSSFRDGIDFATGQTASLSPFDSYRVRLVRGSGAPTRSAFVISPDRTEAFDPVTGLTWRRCMEGRTMGPSGCVDSGSVLVTMGQSEALARATIAGSAWRLPNIKELASIHPLDLSTFPDYDNVSCWSSTPSRFDSGWSWAGNAQYGSVFTQPRSLRNCARLVR